jgi:hypothetical protein
MWAFMFYGLSSARQIKELSELVCDVIGHGANNNAVDLLVETCGAETLLGTGRDHTVYNAGAGCAQVDEGTFLWLQEKYGDSSISKKLKLSLNVELANVQYNELDYSPLLCIVFARLRYWTIPQAIPLSIAQRAQYWKEHYNTSEGKGTPEEYLERCHSVMNFINDKEIVIAATLISDLIAASLNDETLRFDALSYEERTTAINRIDDYAKKSDLITSPTDLQTVNVSLLCEDGWTHGEYDNDAKTSPFLCDFGELPESMQFFIKSTYAVLSVIVFSTLG